MAKIIKQGLFQKEHKLCGSTIEFSYNELVEDFDQDYRGERDYYKYIMCPACNQKFKLPPFLT